ncbi:MAG TPA: plastocyanin/azurin family copper-binding protein, partial [Acidimicrobiales bacterium]|nr:plastocyanin/azurin family copper-binding protein [Acidimicrobiales bacterium]
RSDPLFSAIQGLRLTAPVVAQAQPAAAPRLAQFLQPDIKSGAVAVRDEVDRSVVTIRGDGLFAAGSGDGADVPADVVKVDGTQVAVTALDNTFRIENIQVVPGTTVTWSNKGRNEHNILPVTGDGWGVEVADFQPGAVYANTFDTPGVYRYYCSIHGTTDTGMVGTVVVAGDTTGDTTGDATGAATGDATGTTDAAG